MNSKEMPSGAFTAMVTPFKENGAIDWEGFEKNIEFQISQGIKGLLPVGTTGESPTITFEEHALMIARAADFVGKRVFVLAGAGSNATRDALHHAKTSQEAGCDGILLVDCYYNGPSSLELRKEYYEPIAKEFPELVVVPYIIPGRTGCALAPEDLAILAFRYLNVSAVKEATGDLERMKKTRKLVPISFKIFSGDDDKTFSMMTDGEIRAEGVISVISNIAPAAVEKMCKLIKDGNTPEAEKVKVALDPLFGLVTVKAERRESLPIESLSEDDLVIVDKFRNPLGIKTMMRGLGMPAGPCRRPLGKMTEGGIEIVRNALWEVWQENTWILRPIQEFYGVDIAVRIADNKTWQELAY